MDTIGNPDGARAFLGPNKGKLIGKIPQGQEVTVLGVAGDWTQIKRPYQYDNQTTNPAVWVLTADISFRPVEPPPSETLPEPVPAGAFPIVFDGVTYVNRDEIVWVMK